MFNAYFPLFVILFISIIVALVAITLGIVFGPRHPNLRKAAPYESGMKPYGSGVRRIRLRYYLVTILFILFDIEVVFLLPWAVALRSLGGQGLVVAAVFIFILEVAYVYAWKKGALEWD